MTAHFSLYFALGDCAVIARAYSTCRVWGSSSLTPNSPLPIQADHELGKAGKAAIECFH